MIISLYYFLFILLIQTSFPLINHKFDIQKIAEVGSNMYKQMESDDVKPMDMVKEALKIPQVQTFIGVLIVPFICVLVYMLFSCVFCCCLCCNRSKRYYKQKLNIEKNMMSVMRQHNIEIKKKQSIFEQVIDNNELQADPTMQMLLSQYNQLEDSDAKQVALKGQKKQEAFYMCYIITLLLTLACYIAITIYTVLGVKGYFVKKSADVVLTQPKQIMEIATPFTKGVDKILGKYFFNNENFDFITNLLTGKLEPQDIYDTYDDIVSKIDNITIVNQLLDEINNLYYNKENPDDSLRNALLNLVYFQKCKEDYILNNPTSNDGCSEDDQTAAHKSGMAFLKKLYDSENDMKSFLDTLDKIKKTTLPSSLQNELNNYLNNVDVENIGNYSYEGFSMASILEGYNGADNSASLETIVNSLIDDSDLDEMWKKALMTTTKPENVPTLSDLVGINLTSSIALINDILDGDIKEEIPDFKKGFDDCYEKYDYELGRYTEDRYYKDKDGNYHKCSGYWYNGETTKEIKQEVEEIYNMYKDVLDFSVDKLIQFYKDEIKGKMTKEEADEFEQKYNLGDSYHSRYSTDYCDGRYCYEHFDDYYYKCQKDEKAQCTKYYYPDGQGVHIGYDNIDEWFDLAVDCAKYIDYKVQDTGYTQYAEAAIKYTPLIVAGLCIVIFVLPAVICLCCEASKKKCCYGCIDCCMPFQALIFFFIYVCLFFFGVMNSGLFQPAVKMVTVDMQQTADDVTKALMDTEEIYNKLSKELNITDFKFDVKLPQSDYYKLLDGKGAEVNKVQLDFSGKTVTSFFDSFNYQLNVQQHNPYKNKEIGEIFEEYPEKILSDIFLNLKDEETFINALINQLTKDAVFNLSLAGTSINIFGDTDQSVINSFKIGGQTISDFMRNKLLGLILTNSLRNASLLEVVTQANPEFKEGQEQVKDLLKSYDIDENTISDLTGELHLDICEINDWLDQGLNKVRALFYPNTINDDNIIDIPTKIYNAVYYLTDDVTNNKNAINGINMTIPSTVDSDYVITKLETALYNLIIMNSIQQQESFINGKTTSNMDVADKTFSEVINNMYSTDSTGKVVSNFDTLVNSETIRDATNDFILTVQYATSEQDASEFGCTKDLSGMSDSELTAYIPLYQTAIEGNSELKTKVQRIAGAFYDRSTETDSTKVTVKDAFTMYGYCKAIVEMDQQLLKNGLITDKKTFNGNVQVTAGLNTQGKQLDNNIKGIQQSIKSIYTNVIGDEQKCSGVLLVGKNQDSIQNTIFNTAVDLAGGLLKGIQQSFYPNNTIKPSVLYALQQHSALNTIADFVNNLTGDLLDLAIGDNETIFSQKTVSQPVNIITTSVNYAVKPFESLAVLYYILLIVSLLLPWLLFCSQKQSYKRYYEGQVQKNVKKQNKKTPQAQIQQMPAQQMPNSQVQIQQLNPPMQQQMIMGQTQLQNLQPQNTNYQGGLQVATFDI